MKDEKNSEVRKLDFMEFIGGKNVARISDGLYICYRLVGDQYVVYLQNTQQEEKFQQHIVLELIPEQFADCNDVEESCQEFVRELYRSIKNPEGEKE